MSADTLEVSNSAMQPSSSPHLDGVFWGRLAEAANLLTEKPESVDAYTREILTIAPGLSQALQLLTDSRRAQGDEEGARAVLEDMVSASPALASPSHELGMLLASTGKWEEAAKALSHVVHLEPAHSQAWRYLADASQKTGDTQGAENAYKKQFQSSLDDLKTLNQVNDLPLDQFELAENILRQFLEIYSTDLGALQMLGQLYLRAARYEFAEQIYKRALDLAPSFNIARLGLLSSLRYQLKWPEELKQLELLLEDDPENTGFLGQKAVAMSATGKLQEAVEFCESLLKAKQDQSKLWLSYAHVLRVVGRQRDCVSAYLRAVELEQGLGEAWWGLANLKAFSFDSTHIKEMRAALTALGLSDSDREYLNFALGKALEDEKEYEQSFRHYSAGNMLIRQRNPYNTLESIENIRKEKQQFTNEFMAAQTGKGNPSPEPIFILGLPRSGSTLVEQILASHSLIDGCGELPALASVLRKLELDHGAVEDVYTALTGKVGFSVGADYLEEVRQYRRQPKPYFTDKMPSNFRHLGIICAALPNAKIIDARRHPMATCFSNFKQIFPSLNGPSYDLSDIGHYYRAYVELLAHFDRALPTRIHRVVYEDLVRDPEAEVMRLLQYCGLPFEESCLRFYETGRGIRTISSEQVRRPIYKDSLEQWAHFEPWLGPLKTALGSVLSVYPAVPENI